MTGLGPSANDGHRAMQALLVWTGFLFCAVILNGTVPFLLGADMRGWSHSETKSVLFSFVIYGVFFLTVPLICIKGWDQVRKQGFLLPLVAAMGAVTFWSVLRGVAVVAVFALSYLHWRFNLSAYGFRTRGWRGDLAAVFLLGLLNLAPLFFRPEPWSYNPTRASAVGLDRLFANPASTVENLFYFGFLADRLFPSMGKWLTSVVIGLMYMIHELTNPEYWYSGMNFAYVFGGMVFTTWVYLWRRGVPAIWLGDGVGRFLRLLF